MDTENGQRLDGHKSESRAPYAKIPARKKRAPSQKLFLFGAGDGNRTHYIQLGKLTFYR